jgi:hypothetical protein
VLVSEGLDLLLLDEPALGGLLDQALGRREVVQVQGVAQLNPFRRMRRAAWAAASKAAPTHGLARDMPESSFRVIERLHLQVHSKTSHVCDFLTGSFPFPVFS